jgi:hypothetical protein
MNDKKNSKELQPSTLNISDVRQCIIDYTNWLSKQDLMISESVDGYTFRSSKIGGKKYSAEELYDEWVYIRNKNGGC